MKNELTNTWAVNYTILDLILSIVVIVLLSIVLYRDVINSKTHEDYDKEFIKLKERVEYLETIVMPELKNKSE